MSEIQTTDFDETAANNNAASPNGFPEGMAPSGVNDSAREVMAQIKRFHNRLHGRTDAGAILSSAGSAATRTLTFDTAPASLFTGLMVTFKANSDFDADSTLNVNSLGAKNIQKMTGSGYANVVAGDIENTQHVLVKYDGTLDKWVMLSPVANQLTAASDNAFSAGQTISLATAGNNLTATTTDAGATGSTLRLYHNTASPANSDIPGTILFDGKDSGASDQTWGRIRASIIDVTAASENGRVAVATVEAGTLADRLTIGGAGGGVYVGSPTGTDMGAGTLNAPTIYIDGITLRGYIDGLTISNNGADASNDIDIAAGAASDSAGAGWLYLTSAITKRLDAAWAVGSGNGGLDTGAEANSTWYHIWLIKRPDTGVVDALFSTSATAPTMPTNYTLKRRIGSVYNSAGSVLTAFSQDGEFFWWKDPPLDLNGAGSSTAASATLTVPTGVTVRAIINAIASDGGANGIYLSPLVVNDEAASETAAPLETVRRAVSAGDSGSGGLMHILTNTSAQIRYVSESALDAIRIATLGWIDARGRNA